MWEEVYVDGFSPTVPPYPLAVTDEAKTIKLMPAFLKYNILKKKLKRVW